MELISNLAQIDQEMFDLLNCESVEPMALATLLEQRTQCLLEIAAQARKPNPDEWSVALDRTRSLLHLLKKQRDFAAQDAQRMRKGRKSIQTYHTYIR